LRFKLPSIEDLSVELTENSHQHYQLFFRFKETAHWIPQQRMSAGMFRTLTHLIEISLAASGSVIVIDEFEDIPEFNEEESFHEKIIQLINHPDYRKGVL